jgi:hypothetical protein
LSTDFFASVAAVCAVFRPLDGFVRALGLGWIGVLFLLAPAVPCELGLRLMIDVEVLLYRSKSFAQRIARVSPFVLLEQPHTARLVPKEDHLSAIVHTGGLEGSGMAVAWCRRYSLALSS